MHQQTSSSISQKKDKKGDNTLSSFSIRAFEMDDWEDVAALFLAKTCQRETLQLPLQSRDDIHHRLKHPPPRLDRLVAVEEISQRVVGMIGIHHYEGRRAHASSIGMFVHDDYQRQGVGSGLLQHAITLCEQWRQIKRIELTVFTDNEAAIGLYKKHGFVIEGTLKGYAYREGEFADTYSMARVTL
jgi:putative acetyltransferase